MLLMGFLLIGVLPVATADARVSFGKRTLRSGMHGHDVRVLQDFLTRAGERTPVDGWYGAATVKHVRAWEAANGRPVNGSLSRPDARALRSQVQSAGGAQYVEPAPVITAKATLLSDGTAVAPAEAPDVVKAIIAAGNEIAHKPYHYGGGHGKWNDSGYDCSGSVSYALHGGGLLDEALDSSSFERWGAAGRGSWITIYANGGHAFMTVAGLRFDTSGQRADGTRWHASRRGTSGYVVRHPAGL